MELAAAPPSSAAVSEPPGFFDSDDDSESLALIGISELARRSDDVWADWLVVWSVGFTSRMMPTVNRNPLITATPLSSNLFL